MLSPQQQYTRATVGQKKHHHANDWLFSRWNDVFFIFKKHREMGNDRPIHLSEWNNDSQNRTCLFHNDVSFLVLTAIKLKVRTSRNFRSATAHFLYIKTSLHSHYSLFSYLTCIAQWTVWNLYLRSFRRKHFVTEHTKWAPVIYSRDIDEAKKQYIRII
jgi:hypothetical protein